MKRNLFKMLSFALVILMAGNLFATPLSAYAMEPGIEETENAGEDSDEGNQEEETEEESPEEETGDSEENGEDSEEDNGEEASEEFSEETTEELMDEIERPLVYNKDYENENWQINYRVTNHWDEGYTVEVTIRNTQPERICCWLLKMDREETFTNLWNGALVSCENGYTVFSGNEYNQDIAPMGEIRFGYTVEAPFETVPGVCEIYSFSEVVSPDAYTVEFQRNDAWESGYTGYVTITNLSEETIYDWSLEFDFVDEITQVWDGMMVSAEENHYVISNAGYQCNIYPQGSMTFGIMADSNSADAELTNVSLYGYLMNCREEEGTPGEEEGDPVLEGRTYIKETPEEDIICDIENGAYYARNQLIVSAQLHTTKAEMDEVVIPLGAEVVGVISSISTFQIEFTSDMTYDELEEMADYLNNLLMVEYATFNYAPPIVMDYESNDEFYVNKELVHTSWNPETETINYNKIESDADEGWDVNTPKGNAWGLEALNVPGAWDYKNFFQKPVNVGIYDTMFGDNPDLNITCPNNPTAITDIHGTHVAGIIGAEFDNDYGISGVATDVNLYGYSVIKGDSTAAYTAKVLEYFIKEKKTKVINVSYGYSDEIGFVATNGNEKAQKMINKSAKLLSKDLRKWIKKGYDFLIVNSAGNGNNKAYVKDSETKYGYKIYDYKEDKGKPFQKGNNDAFYNFSLSAITDPVVKSRIIVVGAAKNKIKSNENRNEYLPWENSNLGERVDVYAPGENILSTIPTNMAVEGFYEGENYTDNPFATFSGTSMAAPYITGLAALIWQANPTLTAPEVKNIILENKGHEVQESGGKYMPDAKKCIESALDGCDCIVVGIYDLSDNPINGIFVSFYKREEKSGQETLYFTDITVYDGKVRTVLPVGSYKIVAHDKEKGIRYTAGTVRIQKGESIAIAILENPLTWEKVQ